MAIKGREMKKISTGLVFIIILFIFMKSNFKNTQEGIYVERERTRRESLALPAEKDFDDSIEVDLSQLEKVRDWTLLRNYRNDKIDPGFWECLKVVLKLSPEEISRRAIDLDFSKFKEDESLRPKGSAEITKEYEESRDKAESYRDSIRGKFVRVKGTFEPTHGDYHLPVNDTGRSLIRRFILKKEKFDLLKQNLPEAYYVFALDDSIANYKDEVEVEAIFFKIVKYYTKENNFKYLPLLIARDVKVTSKAKKFVPPPETFMKRHGIIIISGILMFCGLCIISYLVLQTKKRKKFRDEVFKKIRERKKDNDTSSPSNSP